MVVADDDGVVVVPRAAGGRRAGGVPGPGGEGGRGRASGTQRGELSLDVNGMRERLAERGLRYVDYGRATRRTRPMIIDCHGHYTTAPAAQQRLPRRAARAGWPTRPCPRRRRPPISDDEIRESIERNQLRLLRERGGDLMLFSPKASGMEHHVADPATAAEWARACNDLVHRVTELFPDALRARSASCRRRPAATLAGCIAELRRCVDRARLRRLQPQPRPVRRLLDLAADDGRVLVPAVRGDGRARRARDDPRVDLVQPELPHARRALPQRRHHGVHAAGAGRPVRPVPDAAVRHPARRRRGALPLGPLPGPGRPRSAGPTRATRAAQRLLRHLRLPPAGHRPAAPR